MSDLKFEYWYYPQDHPIWDQMHNYSKEILSASICGGILRFGEGSKDTPLHYYRCFKHLTDPTPDRFLEEVIFKYGKDHEPIAIEWTYQQLPYLIRGLQPGLILHSKYDWLAASLDQLAYCNKLNQLVLLEIKCPWGKKIPQTKYEIKRKYIIQILIQMACMVVVEYGYFVVWSPEQQSVYLVQRDNDFLNLVVQYLIEFKHDHLQANVPPPTRAPKHFEVLKDAMEEFIEQNVTRIF